VLIGSWELVACDEKLGEFAVDDNEQLADPALTQFILEVRDASIPPIERRYLRNKGWKQMTTSECLALLQSTGVIETFQSAKINRKSIPFAALIPPDSVFSVNSH
jgi:hypothetical protein